MRVYLDLLSDERIRTIWLGETVNSFGGGLTFWALAWLLYRTFPCVPLLAATVLAILGLATVLGTLGLSAYLDSWDRRRALIVANAALAGLTALLPPVIGVGTLPLLALIAGIGVLRGLPAPALSATLPSLVPPERLPGLQALFNLTWMTGELLAPTAAGLLIAGVGAARVLWLDAGTFVLAALAYALVRFPPGVPPAQERTGEAGGLSAWWSRLRGGWGFVAARPALWGMFLGLAAVNAFFEPYGALLLPRVGERLLGAARGPAGVGALDSVSVGLELLASLWLGRLTFGDRAARRLVLLGCGLPIVFGVLIVLATSYPAALGLAVLQGVSFSPLSVLVGVTVARLTPEGVLGRVSGVRFFFGNAARPLAMGGAGALLPLLGTGPLALALGSAALVLALFGFWRGGRTQQPRAVPR